MGLVSIALAILSVLFIGVGFVLTPVPVLGTVFSFGAPALALAGMVVGGLASSRAKRQGRSPDSAMAGVILSAMAFIPALGVALTCGVCNAAVSSSDLQGSRQVNWTIGGVQPSDGGLHQPSGPAPPPFALDAGTAEPVPPSLAPASDAPPPFAPHPVP